MFEPKRTSVPEHRDVFFREACLCLLTMPKLRANRMAETSDVLEATVCKWILSVHFLIVLNLAVTARISNLSQKKEVRLVQ